MHRSELDRAISFFKRKDSSFYMIELDPIMETSSEAVIQHNLQEEAFQRGYKKGYEEGMLEIARNKDYFFNFEPASKNGDKSCLILAEKLEDGSIKIIREIKG